MYDGHLSDILAIASALICGISVYPCASERVCTNSMQVLVLQHLKLLCSSFEPNSASRRNTVNH